MTPAGRFGAPLDPLQAKHYVAIAAGSGITPVLSLYEDGIVQAVTSRRFDRSFG